MAGERFETLLAPYDLFPGRLPRGNDDILVPQGACVSAEPLESRIARMEGVNVQIADRLNSIDGRLDSLDGRIDSLDRSLRSEIGGVRSEFGTLRSEFGTLRSEMNSRFTQIDGRFTQIDGRFTQIDGRFAQMDQKFTWVIGIVVASWTTSMTATLALFFRH